ncbi:DPH4 homolog [Anopheles nili]|uniref:DPH4 homolog n=1 Tax=Anopheles nili TaxID=185578 RepID=UPI00237BD13F|nr:DPH4 homolog [Anopheles nili]
MAQHNAAAQPNATHYDVLQVARNATLEEIRKSYQTLALRYHPDKRQTPTMRSGEGSNESDCFIRIDEAWKTLRDERLRRIYDAELMQQTCREEHFVNEVLTEEDFTRNEEESFSYHLCRCGGYYILPEETPIVEPIFVSCDECSLVVQIDPVKKNASK